jgi:hypothetical protein
MPMQATTDLWVSDTFGDPWFLVTAEANEGMVTPSEGDFFRLGSAVDRRHYGTLKTRPPTTAIGLADARMRP